MAELTDLQKDLLTLAAEIKRLEAEYNMFFAGRLPRLPWETRARVEQLVKQYDRMNLSNTAQRFRFGSVQARFVSFCDLWERNLKAREEGRGPRGRTPPTPAPSPQLTTSDPPANAEPKVDAGAPVARVPDAKSVARPEERDVQAEPGTPAPVQSIPARIPPSSPLPVSVRPPVDSMRIRDAGRDSDRITALYDELTRARKAAGEPPMPFDRFATVVKAQLAKLGGGRTDVDFRVNVNQGKVTLLAKKADE
jgi:hypothetical protein